MIILETQLAARKSRMSVNRSRRAIQRKELPGSQQGITMIEILVTVVIISVGLLGAAAMVINGLESNRNAYLRTQASILAYDMADRIRANAGQVASYDNFDFDSEDEDAPDLPQCFTSDEGCGPTGLATADLAQWARALDGVDGGVILLPAAVGSIALAGDEITITVSWLESQWDEGAGSVSDQTQNFVLTFNL